MWRLPGLIYLMVRMLIRGFRAGARRSVDCRLPTAVLAIGLLALVVARIVITLHPAGVIDVGHRIGARRVQDPARAEHLLLSLGHGDT